MNIKRCESAPVLNQEIQMLQMNQFTALKYKI